MEFVMKNNDTISMKERKIETTVEIGLPNQENISTIRKKIISNTYEY